MVIQASPKEGAERATRIPPLQYFRFRRAKDASRVEELNDRVTEKALRDEERRAWQGAREGRIRKGEGVGAFVSACERRMRSPEWSRVKEHSERVRRFAYCITETIQKQKRQEGGELDRTELEVIGKLAGYHDIGKTLIAPYLVNREDGTVFGIGEGERIDFARELPVLRVSHVIAGLRFLKIFKPLMSETEYGYAKQVIGWHHIAFDGIGTASAPSYPRSIGEADMKELIRRRGLPEVARIIRTADVYSAIMENRFYLSQSERVVTNITGVGAADAALGMLIAVAGTDVDPLMVEHLIVGKYGMDPESARHVVHNLACRRAEWLREKGGDIRYSLDWVISRDSFRQVISHERRAGEWDETWSTMRVWQRMLAMSNC